MGYKLISIDIMSAYMSLILLTLHVVACCIRLDM